MRNIKNKIYQSTFWQRIMGIMLLIVAILMIVGIMLNEFVFKTIYSLIGRFLKLAKNQIKKYLFIIVPVLLVVIFSLIEIQAGTFEWWHFCVWTGAVILGILVKKCLKLRLVINKIYNYFKFAEESLDVGSNIKREFFMALAPLYFIISVLLLHTSITKDWDKTTLVLSIVIFLFAILLVAGSIFYLHLPKKLMYYTYRAASQLAVLGALTFLIDLATNVNDLMKIGVSLFIVDIFTIAGSVLALSIMFFSLIVITGQN